MMGSGNLPAKSEQGGNAGGIDVIRLHTPTLDHMNPDFVCGLCKSKRHKLTHLGLVVNPMEC